MKEKQFNILSRKNLRPLIFVFTFLFLNCLLLRTIYLMLPLPERKTSYLKQIIIKFGKQINTTVTLCTRNGLPLEEISVVNGVGSTKYAYPIRELVASYDPLGGLFEEREIPYVLKIGNLTLIECFYPINETHASVPTILLKKK